MYLDDPFTGDKPDAAADEMTDVVGDCLGRSTGLVGHGVIGCLVVVVADDHGVRGQGGRRLHKVGTAGFEERREEVPEVFVHADNGHRKCGKDGIASCQHRPRKRRPFF